MTDAITVVPVNRTSCADLEAIFGTRGEAADCRCQRFKTVGRDWDRTTAFASPSERVVFARKRASRLREQTRCGDPTAATTSGLVAYLDREPVGWCAVEPRSAYVRLQRKPLVWAGRAEHKADDSVWAVTCFVTRAGFRRRGISRELARAAVEFARQRGAQAIEGYPMITEPGKEITWGELHVGSHWAFADAGFTEVSRPTLRRRVMRIDFQEAPQTTTAPKGAT